MRQDESKEEFRQTRTAAFLRKLGSALLLCDKADRLCRGTAGQSSIYERVALEGRLGT